MEGDPESSLIASGGDHPCDYIDSKGVTRRVRIHPKEIKVNFGRASGIPANLPLCGGQEWSKLFYINDLRPLFLPKGALKRCLRCYKTGWATFGVVDILTRRSGSRNSGPHRAKIDRISCVLAAISL